MSEEFNPSCSRENGGMPEATRSTVPMWIIVIMLLLLFVGAVYFDHLSGWFNAKVYAPYVSADDLEQFQPKSGAAAVAAHGKQVYETICGICHGTDGMGKPGQAPPLAGSEWVNAQGFNRVTSIPLAGLSGSFQVEGNGWNLSMAPMGAALSDADLAAVLTYVRTSWGNKGGDVTPDDVKGVRAALGTHPTPLNAEDLKSVKE
jgi:mono/diheme cytochrome c family protein